MRLNPDCVRDTLIYLEENLTIDYTTKTFTTIKTSDLVEKIMLQHTAYDAEDIWYAIYNLQQIEYIEGKFVNVGNYKMMFSEIENITWDGHQFLNTIRPQSIWEATKSGAAKIGITSLYALSTIATQVSDAIVTRPDVIDKIVSEIKF